MKEKPLGYKINYKVPDFGVDHEIKNSMVDLDIAQKQIGHTFEMKKKKDDIKMNYFVPSFGADPDIENT